MKNVCTIRSPSGPERGASLNFTRDAYVPFLNFIDRVRISVCFVEAPVPAVEVSRFITEFPLCEANVTFSGAQVAPGTPDRRSWTGRSSRWR